MATPATLLVVTPASSAHQVSAANGVTAAQEWRDHWPLVAAAMAGLSFASVAASSLGLFMEPLSKLFTRVDRSVPTAVLCGALMCLGAHPDWTSQPPNNRLTNASILV